jgi:hypothetical protein
VLVKAYASGDISPATADRRERGNSGGLRRGHGGAALCRNRRPTNSIESTPARHFGFQPQRGPRLENQAICLFVYSADAERFRTNGDATE